MSSATLFICGAAFITTLNFISIFSLSINIENFYIYFLSYTVSVLAIRVFLGWVPDRYGKWRVASPFVFFLGLSVLMLSFVHEVKLLVLSGIIFGCAHGFVYPSIYSIIIESNPKEARAKAFAISSVSFTGGGMMGVFCFRSGSRAFRIQDDVCLNSAYGILGFFIFRQKSRFKGAWSMSTQTHQASFRSPKDFRHDENRDSPHGKRRVGTFHAVS